MPGAPAKLRNISGGLFAKEGGYDDGVTTVAAATDGVLIQPQDRHAAWIERAPMYDGDMGINIASLGTQQRAAPTGFAHRGEFPVRFKGPGVAYDVSNKSTIHRFLEAAGFDATLTATPGSEKYRFMPSLDPSLGGSYDSLFGETYQGGEKFTSSGMLMGLKISAENGGPPMITFPFVAIEAADPADASVPAITYPYTAVPWALASAMVLTLGTYVVPVKKRWTFDLGRSIDNPRGGVEDVHRGFVPVGRNPKLTIQLEATALQATPFHNANGLDPYQLWKVASSISANVTIAGSAQYNRLKGVFAQCQLTGVKPVGGPTGEWELELQCNESTPGANDDVILDTD